MKDDQVMTTDDVMAYLHVNLRTVYRLLPKGLPGFRVGRQWRFRKKEVDAWLERKRGDRSSDTSRPRILVVDDEQAVRDLLVKTLAEAQWDVDAAPDGPTALEYMRGADYDLLITDLRMPGMDGLSVIREARRKSVDMPIIVVTGNSTEASAIESINLGVTGYLTKPFRMQRVLQIAARAMGETPPEARRDAPETFQPQ
jgi:excisionase family DNA binding protein